MYAWCAGEVQLLEHFSIRADLKMQGVLLHLVHPAEWNLRQFLTHHCNCLNLNVKLLAVHFCTILDI